MHYTLIANSVDPEQVEERTIDGDRHLVAKNVTFIRPMELAGGYVPEQSVANSAPAWDEQPLTINHPKNLPDRPWYDDDHGGFYVSANDEEVRRRKVIGHAENPSLNDDGSVSADLAHNADRLEAIANGEAVAREDAEAATELLEALENGDPFDVSSQYFPQPLPPGEYDGEHREEVEAIANADSIAILPTKPGVCSLEDGCGFKPQQATANAGVVRAPVANADQADDPHGEDLGRDSTGNATNYSLTDVSPDDVDEWTDDEWDGSDAIAGLPNPSEDNEAGDLLDATHAVHPTGESNRDAKANWKLPFRTAPDAPVNTRALVAIDAALSGGRGGVEGLGQNVADDVSEWVGEMLEAAPDDIFGSTDDGEPSANTLLSLGKRVASTIGLTGSSGDEPAESGTESGVPEGGYETAPTDSNPDRGSSDPGDDPGATMERDTLIKQITANSEIKRESLEGMGDACLQSTHEHIVANAGGDGNGDDDDDNGQATNTGGQTIADLTVDELGNELADQGFVTEDSLEDVVANAQQQTEKEQRVERIVANSAEYDEDDKDDLMDTPESVLADIETGLSSNSTLPGATGAADRATANAGGDDADEYPDGTIGGGA
ncbi:hypothetical protein SAMN06269185_3269 [Natronoarchaeum philippinense]|uniref:Uncharacterized protein n=1 Tax=Natronoarchaeum philippinense TaxID=558529 RepID=A0A285P9P8_NATPI|nr:hypothetical protein [Natronoarchaeum philippinense]SNZ18158.1 hypothetical protein SAMN06269185_3269 [Natronoarchaeum philippinense]